MFARIVSLSLLTGLLAGVLTTPVQMNLVQPLIVEAERYEALHEAAETKAAPAAHDPQSHSHDAPALKEEHAHAPSDEPSEDSTHRNIGTAVSLTLAAMGYALLLGAFLSQWGGANWRRGLLLGAAGFVAFQLAPALGLPPEPPGVPAADVHDRQLWWLLTAACTGAGLFGLYQAKRRARLLWAAASLGLLALPHLLGAPVFDGAEPILVPQQLMHTFMLASLATAAVMWLLMGGILGALFQRFPVPQR